MGCFLDDDVTHCNLSENHQRAYNYFEPSGYKELRHDDTERTRISSQEVDTTQGEQNIVQFNQLLVRGDSLLRASCAGLKEYDH